MASARAWKPLTAAGCWLPAAPKAVRACRFLPSAGPSLNRRLRFCVSSPLGRSANNPARFTFRKAERLCSRRLLDGLFKHGVAFNAYPLRFVMWRTGAGTPVSTPGSTTSAPAPPLPGAGSVGSAGVKVVLSVSKRFFKRAHDRNRIKRQLREVWRHEKHVLEVGAAPAAADSGAGITRAGPATVTDAPGPLLLGVLYIGREMPASVSYLTHRLRKGLNRLRTELPGPAAPSRSGGSVQGGQV